jgi:threonine-phosphate decarboxylase
MITTHGGQLRQIAAHYGIRASEILDFSANINPDGPPQSVLAVLRRSLENPLTLSEYPDLDLIDLKQSIATHLAIEAASISVANGFVPLLEAAIRARKICRCLLPLPAFSEYRRTLEVCGVEVVPYPLQPHAFAYDSNALIAAIEDANADAILIANPQNPSGHLATGKDITSLIEGTGTTVLLDEAFIDYAPAESLAVQTPIYQNLITFRSVTKFFAMPGLRIAYGIAHPDNAAFINHILPPWPITTLATVAVQAALADVSYQRHARQQNASRRDSLVSALTRLGIEPSPAAANFLLLPLPSDALNIWLSLLKDHRILLRSCANFDSLSGQYLRTAIRTESENARLITALTQVLSP